MNLESVGAGLAPPPHALSTNSPVGTRYIVPSSRLAPAAKWKPLSLTRRCEVAIWSAAALLPLFSSTRTTAQLGTGRAQIICFDKYSGDLSVRLTLNPPKRSKRSNRSTPKRHSQNHPSKHVAQEMHPQNNPRNRNANRQKKQRPLDRRIKVTHHQRHRKRRHSMTGRKRKPVRRQNLRPAMGLKLARPRPLAESLQRLKYKNPENRRCPRRPNRGKLLRPSIDQQHDPQPIPQPPIAHPCGQDHPQTHPPRSPPAVHPPHHTVIAPFDESPESACHSHGC
jgi:hypothetical protein